MIIFANSIKSDERFGYEFGKDIFKVPNKGETVRLPITGGDKLTDCKISSVIHIPDEQIVICTYTRYRF